MHRRTSLRPGGARTLPISPKGRALPAYLGVIFPKAIAVFQACNADVQAARRERLDDSIGGKSIQARIFTGCLLVIAMTFMTI